jgi:tetratricopeptide (TPR) repeat protein
LPERVVDAVVARSDGVPLFAEELTRLVVERQAAALDIPATLQDSLMARLDRLGSAKEVAQIGAVIGREFTYALLEQVSARSTEHLDDALARLAEAELVYARGIKPAMSYVFKHALVRDTAYGSLLKSRRRELHRAIAEALAASFPLIAEGQPELLAHHYSEGGCADEAIAQWHRGGQRALERSANAEAVSHFQRGLALLATQPEGLARAYKELAFRMPLGIGLIASTGYASDEVAENLARARSLCQELGSVPELMLWGLWFFNLVRGDREVTIEMAGQLMALAERTGDTTHRLLAHSAMTSTAHFRGDAEGAREHAAKVLALYDPERHRALILGAGLDPAVSARFYDAGSLWFMGYPDQAVKRVDEALELARHAPHALALAGALAFSTTIRAWRGEPDAAEVLAKELAALSREHGLPVWLAFGIAEQGRALMQRGDAAAGLVLIDEGIAIYRATGAFLNIHGLLCIRAEACLVLGDVAGGLAACEEGLARTERQIDCNQESELRRLRGELLLVEDREAEAEASFIRAIDVARAQCARAWELRAVTSLGRLWRGQGKRGPARQLLAPLVGSYTEGFEVGDFVTAKALLVELC